MTNRLGHEASPYLLQHAHNPVDWYPWGREALARAKSEDKPILLSIGYSACHWCHVMERESFENDAIAQLMNEWFVCIKVDREERPDLDHVYQLVVQLMGRSGGWPLTVFLTPEERPFFGGTYFPPVERYGMPSFPKILQAVWEAFRARRGEIETQAGEMSAAIAQATNVAAESRPDALTAGAIASATARLTSRFDEEHGGFGSRPKFPGTMALDLLLRQGDTRRVAKALDAMRSGGIFDHLGGGFHRYSTDERWLVPHFEKMLYDNALLLRLYADAWRRTGSSRYAETALAIHAYVAREMTSPHGAFYSTQDADSEGEEGKFFVWRAAEVNAACKDDADAARVAKLAFDITPEGNFEETGATVLSGPAPAIDVARSLGLSEAEATDALARAVRAMLEARERRPKPFRDEKVVASWNGLMIGALASAGAGLGQPSMVQAAERALGFVESALVVASTGRVLRHVKEGTTRGPGFLDDHAFVADSALELYQATGDPRWVRLAERVTAAMVAHFYDEADASFFFTPDDGERILLRPKDPYDNAVPSGASVACRVLLTLGALRGGDYVAIAERVIAKLGPMALANPQAMPVSVALVDRVVRGSVDVVLVGATDRKETRALAGAAHRAYSPDLVLAWADPTHPERRDACAALADGKPPYDHPVAYVCRGRTCSRPIASADELAAMLSESVR